MGRSLESTLIAIVFCVMLAACQAPATPFPPTETATIAATVSTTATPVATVTPLPTATVLPTATLFVTPPPTGQPAIVPILMYHHLADLPPGSGELDREWTVSPKNFAAQMEMLQARGFHSITMSALAAHLQKGKPVPSKPIVISFDDGWETDYTVAFPVLKRNHLTGTFYVYTSGIDHGAFLKWSEIDEMARAGMEFGSHTVSHAHLKSLPADEAKKEIVDSKATLEKHLGRPITTFDYPFGEYNASVTELVKNAGYETAVTIAAGYKQRAEDIFTLHRTRVSFPDSLQDLSARLP